MTGVVIFVRNALRAVGLLSMTSLDFKKSLTFMVESPHRGRNNPAGGMAERLKATVLKTVVGKPTGGSNPSPSACETGEPAPGSKTRLPVPFVWQCDSQLWDGLAGRRMGGQDEEVFSNVSISNRSDPGIGCADPGRAGRQGKGSGARRAAGRDQPGAGLSERAGQRAVRRRLPAVGFRLCPGGAQPCSLLRAGKWAGFSQQPR